MFNLTIPYPTWFLLLCPLVGLAYAAALYYKETTFDSPPLWRKRLMALLRFLAVTLIFLLLLSPMLKQHFVEVKKPVVVLAQDHSESVRSGLGMDSSKYSSSFESLKAALEEKYEVKPYSFGSSNREGVDFKYNDKTSNISSLLEELYDTYANQNLGAVVLATDGIYNEGSNPVYTGLKLNVPVYSVALGDTTPKKDIYIKKVYHNKIAYLGDKFTIEVDAAAFNCKGSNTKLTVSRVLGGNTQGLSEQMLAIDAEDYFKTNQVLIEAKEVGIQRYRIALSGVSGESSQANNQRDIFVEILDTRQKILVVANSPHPDLSAIKQLVDLNANYKIDIQYVDKIQGGLGDADFVILHQVPGLRGTGDALINEMKTKRIPHLFVLGAQSNLPAFNSMQTAVVVKGNIAQTNDVMGKLAPGFGLFTLGEKVAGEITKFPPLVSPFGEYVPAGNSQVLLKQKIGSVETNYPLLLFGENQGMKTGVLCAEGFWKWRMFDYLQNQNTDIYADIIGKTITYLAVKEDKRRFRVSAAKSIFNENEQIFLDAELYNKTFELVNEPDAFVTITDESGKKFNFTFNKTGKAYTLNAQYFPVGNYSYEAYTNYQGEKLTAAGKFSIQSIELERYQTTADHKMLRLLAEKTGGRVALPANMASISELLTNDKKIPALRYESLKTSSIINLKWLFFLILGLLSAEWFMRRYFGGY